MTENESYVDEAKVVIEKLKNAKNQYGKPIKIVSTSQIRNLLSMTADIYNQVKLSSADELTKDIKDQLQYLRVRIVYDAGREESVKDFVKTGKILEKLKVVKTKEDYITFSRYMEALVAWRKYLCEKDD
ncbi:MAG: type III-A CRISPR-associated protein Csm2 [Selenomonadaceae bacterium]|nr:type III-A CRISPR-associated protein Csm2 [Selenomonadaceae bacterium]MBR3623075.1 type III-A CRISPR-associated protein Csm2 [Selenomonadaceae bacterium]